MPPWRGARGDEHMVTAWEVRSYYRLVKELDGSVGKYLFTVWLTRNGYSYTTRQPV